MNEEDSLGPLPRYAILVLIYLGISGALVWLYEISEAVDSIFAKVLVVAIVLFIHKEV